MTAARGWTVKPAFAQPLFEWDPSSLPGYADALAKVQRGESLFPKAPKRLAHPRRSLSELRVIRALLLRKLTALAVSPLDPAAARLRFVTARQVNKRQDARLEHYARISTQLERIENLITTHPDSGGIL